MNECLLIHGHYSTCFGRPSRPSSGVHKTVVVASGTDHTIWGASFLKRAFEEVRSTPYPAYDDGTDRVFRNVGIQQSDDGEIPKRIHTK